MKLHFGRAERIRLTALVVGGLLCASTASAANLVSTIPSDYGNSEMGAVTGSRVTTHIDAEGHPGVLKNLNRDPASFGLHLAGRSMVFLRQYTYSTTELEGNLLIDPNSEGAAAAVASGKVLSVPNAHAAAGTDTHIYVTGYDLGKIGVVRRVGNKLFENRPATVDLKEDIKKYCGYNFTESFQNLDEDQFGVTGKTYTGDPAKAVVHGEALLTVEKKLYVAVSVNPLGGYDPYDDGFLMQYDIQDDGTLKFGSYTRISRNIDQGRLNRFNDYILVSCIGGYQHYNGTGNTHHTALSVAKIDDNGKLVGTEKRNVKLPTDVTATGQDMRDLKILPNGTAYVMTYNLSPSGSQINARVYQTTVSNLLSDSPKPWNEIVAVENEEGWFGKLNAEYYTKRLWLELGDTLRAYEDGDDTERYKWQARDFSDNKAFSRFNKITMLEPDHVHGDTASVVLAAPPSANDKAVWKSSATLTDSVTQTRSFGSDAVISIGKNKLGDYKTNVLAAVYADSSNIDINAAGHKLNLQVENTVGNPTGIYAGNGKNVTVSASEVNIITKGFAGGNTLTNAVQLDAAKKTSARITINAPVNISMTGGYGGNGVAVQKSDRLGEKSYEASKASTIRINNDLRIAGASTDQWGIPLNRENVFSRFNNAGILTQVEKSNVTVTGNVDMTVYGNGVTTNAANSSVHISGGTIQVPANMKYSYYALAAYQGTINMNTGAAGNMPGTRDVKLAGDLFALPTGKLNVALTTSNSYLHGLIDNGGTADLYLQNTAKWINEGRNERYYQDDEDKGSGALKDGKYIPKSRITNFYGGAAESSRGFIFQKNAQEIAIDNYSGHTKVVYEHDAAAPTVMKGGDIRIAKAAADSGITLSTHNAGLNTESTKAEDKSLVNATLNALANKLYYTAYTTGERNLSGKAEIAEGLVSSSATLKLAPITFRSESGQGQYTPDTPKPDTPKPDTPKPDTPKPDTPKPDTPKPDTPKPDTPKPDTPKPDTPKPDTPKPDTPKPDTPKPDTPKPDTPKPDTPKPDTPKPDTPKPDTPKPDTPKPDTPKPDTPKPDTPKPDTPKPDTPKPDTPKPDTPKPDTPKPDTPKPDTPKPDTPKPDTPKPDTPKPDTPKPQPQTKFTTGIGGTVDADYTKSGIKKADNTYVFDLTSTIVAAKGITASASAPITVKTGSDATLNIQASKYGIDAGANSQVNISGNRVSIDTGSVTSRRTIHAAAGSLVNIASGFDIKGAVENKGGAITLDDTGKKSTFDGDITQTNGTLNLKLKGEGSTLRSNIRARGTLNIDLTGKNTVFTGSLTEMTQVPSLLRSARMTPVAASAPSERSITIGSTSTWNVTDASDITNLTAEGGRIVQQSDGLLNIKNYTGNTTVFYEGTADKNGNLTLAHNGKVQVQNITGTKNRLTFATKAFGETAETEKKVAAALAGQFRYTGDRTANIENNALKNLDLDVVIGEGILKSEVTYQMLLDPATGTAGGVKEIARPLIGSYETQVMRGVKSAMASSATAWRAEANDLMKRMGDLRLSPEDAGLWARVYRGKSSSGKDGMDYSLNYTTIQIGYDKQASKDWRVGVAGSYMSGSSSYTYGSGKNKEGNFGVYGTWSGKDGAYVDLIAKIGRLSNDFTVSNPDGLYVKGDYKTLGMSMSAEYGKRIAMAGGSYIEPQAELIYTHLNGANYTGLSSYTFHGGSYPDLEIRQGAMNSFIGRIGIGFGRETERSTCFAKISLYHEFAGSLATDYVVPTQTKSTHLDFKDTWIGLQLGGTMKLSDRTNIYGSFEKTFAGDIKTDWRVDAGMRWNF